MVLIDVICIPNMQMMYNTYTNNWHKNKQTIKKQSSHKMYNTERKHNRNDTQIHVLKRERESYIAINIVNNYYDFILYFFYWRPLHKCVNTFTTSGQILPTWMLFVSSFFIAVLFLCWPLEGSVTPVVNNWSASSPFGPCQVASERLSFQVLWPL